jgi:hypothetical protein
MRENIRVVVRFRPLNQREQKDLQDKDFSLNIDQNTIQIGRTSTERGRKETHNFTFDNVFEQDVPQKVIFEKIARNAIEWVSEGYNATIFAYGPTGTGKTFTMFGLTGEKRGIIPRSCEELFHLINENVDVVEANVKCSFLEIYRENIRDLLLPTGQQKSKEEDLGYIPSLRVRQNVEKGVYVQGLIEKYVYSPDDILKTIEHASANRSVASTALNNTSSRSHAVLTLTVTQTLIDGSVNVSKLNLVDLAGSENVEKSEAKGKTLLEAQMINKSLSALGNVIFALTESGREHIPYRDSRLTYLLQDSLGGNAKAILVSTATPCANVYSETVGTLKFAKRAKEIKNAPKVNKHQSSAAMRKTIELLQKRIDELEEEREDSRTIIQKVEEKGSTESNKMNVVLTVKCERLQKKVLHLESLQIHSEQRYTAIKVIFEKQRTLAQMAARKLYKEQMVAHKLASENRQYKMFYESLKDCLSTPEILEMLVKNANIVPAKLTVDTSFDPVVGVEVDSPSVLD